MPNVAQTPAPDLQAMAARVAELRQMADDMYEALQRASAATGIPLVPASPKRRHLSLLRS